MKYKIGDIVIAKNSHEKCGYRRGDSLKIVRESCFDGEFVAENLTRPNVNGDGRAYLGDLFRGKNMYTRKDSEIVYTVHFLGIKLFAIKKVIE